MKIYWLLLLQMLYKRFYIFLGFILFLNTGFAQSTQEVLDAGGNVNVLFRNESSWGIFIHSRGLGVNYMRAKHVTGTRKKLFEIQALNIKHPKEIKVSNSLDNSKRFKYGKLNNVFVLRGGVGYQTTIYKKADKKSVEIRSAYFLGANLSFAKPSYILVYRQSLTGVKYQESIRYNPEVHNIDSVSGRGPLLDGLGELKVYPGFYAKANLSFEYAPYSNKVKAIETGVIFDFYPNALPIMARNTPENFIVTLYVSFVFGKKWF